MKAKEQNEHITSLLQGAGLRLTRQRVQVAALLFDGCHKHVTAEQVHAATAKGKAPISLATIYNTLHQFTDAGLLRHVMIDHGRTYFDTNTESHHHFFHEDTGHLIDIPEAALSLPHLPKIPNGTKLERVDIILRLSTR